MPHPETYFPSQRGATLVELLIALGLGVMVVAVIVLAHYALTSETSRLNRTHQRSEQQEQMLFTLREDLQQLFLPSGDPDCDIALENSATNLIRFRFCRWENLPYHNLSLATNRLEQITYQFSDDPQPALLMIRRALTGPAALAGAITNRLTDTWPRLLIHLHDGETWKTNWVPAKSDDTTPPRPRAARITLLDESPPGTPPRDPVMETIVVIPSGLSVTSTLLRAGSSIR